MVLEGEKGKVLADSQQNDKKANYRQNYLRLPPFSGGLTG